MLRKILLACGVLFLLGLGTCGLFALKTDEWQREAVAYAEVALESMSQDWSPASFESELTPEAAEAVTPRDMTMLVMHCKSNLGKLKTYVNETWKVDFNYTADGLSVLAQLTGLGSFEKGDSNIILHCLKKDDEWKIQYVHFSPVEAQDGAPVVQET